MFFGISMIQLCGNFKIGITPTAAKPPGKFKYVPGERPEEQEAEVRKQDGIFAVVSDSDEDAEAVPWPPRRVQARPTRDSLAWDVARRPAARFCGAPRAGRPCQRKVAKGRRSDLPLF